MPIFRRFFFFLFFLSKLFFYVFLTMMKENSDVVKPQYYLIALLTWTQKFQFRLKLEFIDASEGGTRELIHRTRKRFAGENDVRADNPIFLLLLHSPTSIITSYTTNFRGAFVKQMKNSFFYLFIYFFVTDSTDREKSRVQHLKWEWNIYFAFISLFERKRNCFCCWLFSLSRSLRVVFECWRRSIRHTSE